MCTMDAELTSGQRLMAESIHMGVEVKVAADKLDRLEAENEQYRELIRILNHDWNIDASWDGLRKFWHVGLTEKGVAERDERDAENAKLRKLVAAMWDVALHPQLFGDGSYWLKRMRDLGIEVE